MSNESVWEKAATYLSHTGETVTDYTTPSTPLQTIFDRLYTDTIEEALAMMDWGFARKRAALTDVTATEEAPPEWQYAWTYPTDCVAIRGFTIEGRPRGQRARVNYEVGRSMDDATARVLYTSFDPFDGGLEFMVYTKRLAPADFAEWTVPFEIALAAMLAGNAGLAVGRDTNFQGKMFDFAQRKAFSSEAIEYQEERHNPGESSLVMSRN